MGKCAGRERTGTAADSPETHEGKDTSEGYSGLAGKLTDLRVPGRQRPALGGSWVTRRGLDRKKLQVMRELGPEFSPQRTVVR